MKKVISLFLILAICLSLWACGKSDAVKLYDSLVSQIGTVSLSSESAIAAAENAYGVLTEEEKASVAESYALYLDKRAEYDALVVKAEQEKRLAAVAAMVDALGTSEDQDAIIAAEEAYGALSAEEQAMLFDVEEKLSEARARYHAAVAAEVTAAIEAIGSVTLESQDAIAAARARYDQLNETEQELVENYSILEEAEAEYKRLKEEERQQILNTYSKKFDIEEDSAQGVCWYLHEKMPSYIDTRSYIITYIGTRDNTAWVCIRYNYTGDSWILWDNLTITVDGKQYHKTVGVDNTLRDSDSEVWEYYDTSLNYNEALDSEDMLMLRAIADSGETVIRFQGENDYYDLYVTDQDKQIIHDTLTLYAAMLGAN